MERGNGRTATRLHFSTDRIRQSRMRNQKTGRSGKPEVVFNDTSRRFSGITGARPILYTNFLLHCLLDSVAVFARDSSTLTSLTLDGFPLRPKYLGILCSGVASNRKLTKLSLVRCRIGDNGCDLLLGCLKNNPNLSSLNLSACRLTGRSSRCLSLFLKRRKADLLQNIWEESSEVFCQEHCGKEVQGLRTLILNQNPKFGDNGLKQLSYAFKDDEWLRSLSMRHCGITKFGVEIMMHILKVNNVITELDFTGNHIPINTLQALLKVLKRRREISGTTALTKTFRLGRRRSRFKRRISKLAKRNGKRFQSHNRSRIRECDNEMKEDVKTAEVKSDLCGLNKLCDLETQLLNLVQLNFKLSEELLSNKTLLNKQAQERFKLEYELQKMSLRLDDLKSKAEVLNCFSLKSRTESQLMMEFKYLFHKLDIFPAIKENTIESEIVSNRVESLWESSLNQSGGNSIVYCLQERPYCPPLKI